MVDPDGATELATRLAAARAALRSGDELTAADLSAVAGDGDITGTAHDRVALAHVHVLALARAGATSAARRALVELDLEAAAAQVADAGLAEEVAALGARLAKDAALASGRRADLAAAAAAYGRVHAEHTSAYAAVNAATLHRLAGDDRRAHRYALAARDLAQHGTDHWALLTTAEAALVLGEVDAARGALRAAADRGTPVAARATARRQLALLLDGLGHDHALLDDLPVPRVAHACGHVLAGDDGGRLRAQVDEVLAAQDVGVVVQSLAAGGDVVVAEAALARGADLHVVLPFDLEDFLRVSVAVAGPGWVERARRCLEAAASCTQTSDGGLVDDLQFAHASRVGMGLALLHADALTTEAIQVAVWDEVPATGPAGTGADVAAWRGAGHRTVVVSPTGTRVRAHAPGRDDLPPRAVRAVLFGDVAGFSSLPDAAVPAFFAQVMGRLAAVLQDAGEAVEYRNGWGDGLYVVCRDVESAVEVAGSLHAAVGSRPSHPDLPDQLLLRLGVHAGLVFKGHDPIRDEPTFFGGTTTIAARIEPRTPPGTTYVTEPFAALWRLAGGAARHGAQYVGRVPLAKDGGTIRMRRLAGVTDRR